MTPDQFHYEQADEVQAARQKILDLAYAANPERLVKKTAKPSAQANRSLDQSADKKLPITLGGDERRAVLELLRAPRFIDLAPAEVYASLLDEGVYLCSIRTMYRVLTANDEVRERRRQLRHPAY
jgi:hypothetical protein